MRNKFDNIFKSAEFSLTMFYFLIIVAISAVFNIVIFSVCRVDEKGISNMDISVKQESRDLIISARNSRAEQQIFEAMMILDFAIVFAGSWGSFVLARRTLEPLEKAHKLQSEFVSNASHELRTPLATIQLETELILKDKNATREELREILKSNLEEAQSLDALTKMLLKLSQVERDFELESVNLNEIIKNRISKFSGEKIDFSETKVFSIYANSTAVDELATILLDNAIKYNNSKNPIEVKIFRSNRQAVLEVANFSEKIEKEELEKLFERFYRKDSARTCNGRQSGHGLGLSIAKKLTEALGATISVRNEKIGKNEKEKYRTVFAIGFKFEK